MLIMLEMYKKGRVIADSALAFIANLMCQNPIRN